MKDSLTKSQLCWALIRFLGFYLILQAALTFSGLVAGALMVEDSSAVFLKLLLLIVPPVAIGIHLLQSGRMIHGWLMNEPEDEKTQEVARTPPIKRPPDPAEEVDPTTTLTRKESEVFAKWLKEHPEFQARQEPDQIALFRDAQNSRETNE